MLKFLTKLDGFYQANGQSVKNTDYDEMMEYADSYACDDIEMYVALYRCANTHWQRNRVLKHIHNIIIDTDSVECGEDLIQKFKEFVSLKDYLDERDEEKFDSICMKVIDFFINRFQNSVWRLGRSNSAPETSILESSEELKEVAEIIISTDMRMESYQVALQVMGA